MPDEEQQGYTFNYIVFIISDYSVKPEWRVPEIR